MVTRPDRPAGRGQKSTPGAVKRLALDRRLQLFQPATIKSPEALARLQAARPEAIVVAAYGQILPQEALDVAPQGAINIHASLLPRWRGAAPIQRALLAGDPVTGISIMRMDAGLDTGPVLARHPVPIAADDDAGSLHDKLAELGAQAIVDTLSRLKTGDVASTPQGEKGVTYAAKLEKHEIWLDWAAPAAELERRIRALRPSPGAATRIGGEALKVWRARIASVRGVPGTVLDTRDALVVACGEHALVLEEVQRPGARRMAAQDFLRGFRLAPGARLE